MDMGKLFDEVELELLKEFKSLTPGQLEEEENRKKIKRAYEELHTPIETDEERADTYEYPEDDED
jgi:hypothetical protein